MINYSLGNWKSKAEQSLRDAGIITHSERYERRKRRVKLCDGSVHDLGNCMKLLKNASTERSVTLYEPLLILFEDGNVIELLPCATKGLRIGYNTLPREMRNGVNRCEFDVGALFNSFISGQRLFMVDVISTVANVTYSGNRKNSVCKRDEFRLYFSSGYLRLEELQCSEYKLSFPSVDLIKCGELAELGEQSYQEQILEGSHGGASVNIYPVNGTDGDEYHFDTDNPDAISIGFGEPTLFCPLLKKYFDPELPINKEYSEGHYDFFYWNYYTKDNVLKMVEEALKNLEEVRSLPTQEQCDLLSCGYKDQTEEEMLLRIAEEISFTERFAERLRGMALNTPEYNFICFAGP